MAGTEKSLNQPLWLTEDDVKASVDLNTAISALEQGICEEVRGGATNFDKVLGQWGKASSVHGLGSMMPGRGYAGFKTWANTPGGAMAIFSLFSTENGELKALISAGLLGAFRTSGISALASRALAEPGANEMAIIGTGRQAMLQVAAVAATVPLKRLRVFSRSAENRAQFVERAAKLFPFVIEDSATLEGACRDMPIVTLITRAAEPFLDADMLAKGTHLNAAGAVLPTNAEFHANLFDRASLVVVDNLANARKASRELREHFGESEAAWSETRSLGEVLVEGSGRPPGADLTIFKPMGMGLSDLSVAIAIYEHAAAGGVGQPLPLTGVSMPKWTLA